MKIHSGRSLEIDSQYSLEIRFQYLPKENLMVLRIWMYPDKGGDRIWDLGQGQLWSSFPCATFNKGSEGGKYSMSIIPIDILKELFSNFLEQIFSHFLEEIFSSFPKEIFSSFLKRNTVKLWPSLPHATFNKGRQLEENIHYSFYFRKTFVCKKINDFKFCCLKNAYLSIFR